MRRGGVQRVCERQQCANIVARKEGGEASLPGHVGAGEVVVDGRHPRLALRHLWHGKTILVSFSAALPSLRASRTHRLAHALLQPQHGLAALAPAGEVAAARPAAKHGGELERARRNVGLLAGFDLVLVVGRWSDGNERSARARSRASEWTVRTL